jgi:catechol 2,3-dioxygenase-like lactoylglutathione lyase family enzyme
MKFIVTLFLSLLMFQGSLMAQEVSLKITGIALIVDDPEACRDWYTGYLGFTLVKSPNVPGLKTITLRKNELEISLQQGDKAAGTKTGLSFEASDINSLYQRLRKKHVAFEAEVMSESLMVGPAAPLQKFFMLKDPQGNSIIIKEKL